MGVILRPSSRNLSNEIALGLSFDRGCPGKKILKVRDTILLAMVTNPPMATETMATNPTNPMGTEATVTNPTNHMATEAMATNPTNPMATEATVTNPMAIEAMATNAQAMAAMATRTMATKIGKIQKFKTGCFAST